MHNLSWKILIISILTLNSLAGLIPKHKVPKNDDVIQVFDMTNKSMLPGTFKVAVWNMYKGKKPSWETSFFKLAHSHDILISQEMFMKGRMEEIFTSTEGFEFTSATSFYFDGNERTGVATISKVPSFIQEFQRSHYREPIIRSPKVVLVSTYPLANGEELLVANIHAINFVSARKLRHQIQTVANRINEHVGPVIFAGDFNTWSRRKQRYMRKILKAAGLTEVKYHGGDHRMRVFKNLIDFLWYRGLKLEEAKVLGNIDGADHIPMSHTFSLLN